MHKLLTISAKNKTSDKEKKEFSPELFRLECLTLASDLQLQLKSNNMKNRPLFIQVFKVIAIALISVIMPCLPFEFIFIARAFHFVGWEMILGIIALVLAEFLCIVLIGVTQLL